MDKNSEEYEAQSCPRVNSEHIPVNPRVSPTNAKREVTGVIQNSNYCTAAAARNKKASSKLQEIKPPQKSVEVGTINGRALSVGRQKKQTLTKGQSHLQQLEVSPRSRQYLLEN